METRMTHLRPADFGGRARKHRGVSWTVFSIICFAVTSLVFSCRESFPKNDETITKIDATIGRLLIQYQIVPKSIETRRVKSGDGRFARTERRIIVPVEFNTLEFNRALAEKVEELGATVIATEKSEEKSVSMHIKKDEIILHSVVFILRENKEK